MTTIPNKLLELKIHQQELSNCSRCENMIQPVITGNTVDASIMTVGQAPGIHEGRIGKPFGWTAGKTLFKWFASIGVEEDEFRQQVYMAAVCRCFPGKNPKGSGDRVPDKQEIATCKSWIEEEYKILQPKLIIPIGKLAISQYLPHKKLSDVVGQQFVIDTPLLQADCIPLPHPSGLSTWFNMEPGKTLLQDALGLIDSHKAWSLIKDQQKDK
ncbi:uracil-DNA glycosylase family protein [Cocleimonas sp. KMM 6892]|uniref:uracil-DNA glycosylase family protein n=1 Tax=unclassified Cocleimonas TaxID=2639732 RepID=UPI002DB91759|nr:MULTISPECIES: uracil-DNA glycosylase family protein [unclassified Cocleimonas]MEB8434261.1 uracil-DNA glycosylase family protein [Cocleimonas sp. KMM 6892]MEC4717120.1 uracil-DNA glycosylase family protein [Cocleimonas sp. KMM 6895]MEC4746533.1 uracil-DNA glycosylase family protein [Cocleimonas sp. KMM 6896]